MSEQGDNTITTKLNSFFWFLKKICADYQQNKIEDQDYTKMNAPKLAQMASYHWSHMTDLEKAPYRRAAALHQMPKIEKQEPPSYIS
jgi:hypothetical protein